MGPDAGELALTRRFQFRMSEGQWERTVAAATECELTVAEWLRAVNDQAVQAFEERERIAVLVETGDMEPPDDWFEQTDPEPEEPQVTPPIDDDYAERVRAEGQRIREQRAAEHAETPTEKPERPDPKTCAHLPIHRQGDRCTNCGARLAIRRSGLGGRYVPPMR
jgi:hypothetical protein